MVAAGQMLVVAGLDGAMRAGYDPGRNWVSQLSLGPHGWVGVVNLATCGGWLVAYAIGLLIWLPPSRGARWAGRLVLVCAAGFLVIAAVPIDPGLGYPPGVPAVHTGVGYLHQAGAIALFAAGTLASALLGRCVGAARAGLVVAGVMTIAFLVACVLVALDVTGTVEGTPSGLFERVALFTGLGWIGFVGLRVLRRRARFAGCPGSSPVSSGRSSA